MAATRSPRAADPFAARNVWLAGLGLASVARRESANAVRGAAEGACRLRAGAVAFAGDARDIARGLALTLQERIEPAVAEVLPRIGARIAPVLPKFGAAAPRAARRPVAHTRKAAAHRRTPAKTAR